MSIAIMIILILASLVLIVSVLMQEGNKQGLGAIGGAAETFLGKNKAKSAEGKLLNITRVTAVVFVVLALLATWLNSRTYSVTYLDENGKEYFPAMYSDMQFRAMLSGTSLTYEEAYEQMTQGSDMSEKEIADRLRSGFQYGENGQYKMSGTTYSKGDKVYTYDVPVKEGYSGEWRIATKAADGTYSATEDKLPETMGRTNYTVVPVYTINSYTLQIVDNGPIEEEPEVTEDAAEPAEDGEPTEESEVVTEGTETPETEGTEEANTESAETTEGESSEEPAENAEEETEAEPEEEPAKEDNVIFTVTLNYGETINYEGNDILPAEEGYYIFYSTSPTAVADGNIYNTKLPETMPAASYADGTTTYYVCYAKGNFVEYYYEQPVYEDVEVDKLDDEGNPVLDADGNPEKTTERQAKVDENGEAVTEEIELYPNLMTNISNSLVDQWQSEYMQNAGYTDFSEFWSAIMSDSDARTAYNTAYTEATASDGILAQYTDLYYNMMVEQYTENDQLDAARQFVNYGEKISTTGVPVKTGYVGVWEPEVPETMGSERLQLHATYYPDVTLTIIDDGLNGEKIPGNEPEPEEAAAETEDAAAEADGAEAESAVATEGAENTEETAPAENAQSTEKISEQPAAEEGSEAEGTEAEAEAETEAETEEEEKHNVLFTISGAGRTIKYPETVTLPEAPEGYTVRWSEDLPKIVPDEDTTIFVVYEEIGQDEEPEDDDVTGNESDNEPNE